MTSLDNAIIMEQYRATRVRRAHAIAYDCCVTHLVEAHGDLARELCDGISVAVMDEVKRAVSNDSPAPEFVGFQAGVRYYQSQMVLTDE